MKADKHWWKCCETRSFKSCSYCETFDEAQPMRLGIGALTPDLPDGDVAAW